MESLRRATAADAPAMRRIADAAYSPYVSRMEGRRPGPLDADYAAAVADDEAWVVEADGHLVGFLVLIDEEDAMLLDNVAVLPTHHGRGIGRALLELAERRAAAAGRTRIRLFTHVTMLENQRLYERIGYVETHRGARPAWSGCSTRRASTLPLRSSSSSASGASRAGRAWPTPRSRGPGGRRRSRAEGADRWRPGRGCAGASRRGSASCCSGRTGRARPRRR